ncbi:MAG: PASTA domain-containing protein [Chitinophagaceae bacterium]|nr:PASTA domain-containing protein [Chitinophagaceae bacterium]
MFQFITKRSLIVNILVAAFLAFAVFFVFFQLLDWITKHGDYIKVPEVKGKSIDEARKILNAQGFEVEVQDSVYYDSLPKLSVVKQSPDPEQMVKINRTVYLTVNRAQPPMVTMPNFVGQPLRSVEMQLKTLGFKLGDTTFKPDFAVGSILEQLYNGSDIKPGTKIPMGSRISLVIGGGVQDIEMAVPDLVGMTFGEARVLLETNGLLLGAVVVDGVITDSSSAFVIQQNPPRRDEEGRPIRIRGGQLMDLWISKQMPLKDSTDKPKPVARNDY